MAPCEKRASTTCEIRLVTTFPTPSAMNAQINARVAGCVLASALLTNPTRPAFQAPLNSAFTLVQNIKPRQVRSRNLNSIIRVRQQHRPTSIPQSLLDLRHTPGPRRSALQVPRQVPAHLAP